MEVSLQTVREWERGRKYPHLRKLPRLGQVLGVLPGSFFPGPSDPSEWPHVAREFTPPAVEPRLAELEAQLRHAIDSVKMLRNQTRKSRHRPSS
jgi:transcriptional regulator with XRE-family HTH domain